MVSQGHRRRPRKLLIVSVAVGLCALTAGVALAVSSSSPGSSLASSRSPGSGSASSQVSGSAAASGQPSAGAKAAKVPGTVGGVVTDTRSDGTAKTSLKWPPSLQNQMVSWKAGSGGAALTAVTGQLGNATQAGGAKIYPTMRIACANLSSAIRKAQAAPPIPDGVMQRSYAASLVVLSSAASNCHQAISEHPEGDEEMDAQINPTLMNRALTEFNTGSKQLYTATAEIRALKLPR